MPNKPTILKHVWLLMVITSAFSAKIQKDQSIIGKEVEGLSIRIMSADTKEEIEKYFLSTAQSYHELGYEYLLIIHRFPRSRYNNCTRSEYETIRIKLLLQESAEKN
jgi:hypothetical protein